MSPDFKCIFYQNFHIQNHSNNSLLGSTINAETKVQLNWNRNSVVYYAPQTEELIKIDWVACFRLLGDTLHPSFQIKVGRKNAPAMIFLLMFRTLF